MRGLQRFGRRVADLLGRDSWFAALLRPLYARVLLVLSGGRGIPWTINGVEYRIDPRYRHRMGPRYDAPVAAFLRDRVRPGDLCIEVGANVGVYALQFAHWSRPDGRVIAFEPAPAARTVLTDQLRMNDLDDRVTVVAAAVGATAGQATLFAAGSEGMNRLHAPNPLATATDPLPVPVVTLDAYCARHDLAPRWILIDVEGYELEVLRGATRLVRAGAAPGIVVELHPDAWSPRDDARSAAELLEQLGRRAEPLTGQRDPLAEHGLVHLAPA